MHYQRNEKKKLLWFTKPLLVAFLIAVFFTSCVVSLSPLYHDEDLLTDQRLEGKWLNTGEENETWQFIPAKDKSYKLLHTEDTNRAEFKVHLLKLNGNYFIDLYPKDLSLDNSLYDFHFIRVHSFFKLDFREDELALYMFDSEWLENLQDSADIELKLHMQDEEHAIITSETDELQAFVKNFVNDSASFEDPLILKRQQ